MSTEQTAPPRKELPPGVKGDPEKVREAVKHCGRPASEIAGALSITPATLAHYLKETRPYTLTGASLLRFASVVGVPVESLFPAGTNGPEPRPKPASTPKRPKYEKNDPEDLAAFGERLAAAMLYAKLDKHALADAAEVGVTAVNNWIACRNFPWKESLEKMAGALGVEPEWLRYGTNEPAWMQRPAAPEPVSPPSPLISQPSTPNQEPLLAADPARMRMAFAGSTKKWKQLASELGLPDGTLGDWLRGDRQIYGENLVRFAAATGKPASFFVTETSLPVAKAARHDPEALPASEALPGRMREAMNRLRMNNRDVSRKMGISPARVGLWKSGQMRLNGTELQAVARILGVEAEWLAGTADSQLPLPPSATVPDAVVSRMGDPTPDFERSHRMIVEQGLPFVPVPEVILEAEKIVAEENERERASLASFAPARSEPEPAPAPGKPGEQGEEEDKPWVYSAPAVTVVPGGREETIKLGLTMQIRVLAGSLMQVAQKVEDLERHEESLARARAELEEERKQMEADREEARTAFEMMQEQMQKLLGGKENRNG